MDARQRPASCTFGVTVLAPPIITLTRFAAFGDSMTRGEDGNASTLPFWSSEQQRPLVLLPAQKTYPGVLQQLLSSRYTTQSMVVDNFGNPAERAGAPATRSRFSSVASSGYQAVLIMEGANDLADRNAASTDAAIASLGQMVRDAKSRGVRPFLATIPPQVPGGSRSFLSWPLVAPFNDRVRALAVFEGATLVDVYAGLVSNTPLYINNDGEHLTEAGYAKIADVFFTALRGTLERVPAITLSRPQAALASRP